MTDGRYQFDLDPHHRIEAAKDIIRQEFRRVVKVGESTISKNPCILTFWPIKSFLIRRGRGSSCLNKLDEISLDTLTVSRVSPNKSVFRFFLVGIDFGFKGTVHGLI